MSENAKDIVTTLDSKDGDASVAAMQQILDNLRKLPDWPKTEDGLKVTLGTAEVEVTSQTGAFEAFAIVIKKKLK